MHQCPSSGASDAECRRATAFFINFGLGGPDCFNANLSELDRRLKGASFRDATELHTLAAMLKLASDLVEDIFAQLRMTQAS